MFVAALASLVLVQYEAPASNEEKNAAQKVYIDCLMQQAEKLDDRASDAATIAQGISPMCVSKLRTAEEVWGRGLDPDGKLMLTEHLDADQQKSAVTAVLTVRAHRRGEAR
jgi:hypothetical protein